MAKRAAKQSKENVIAHIDDASLLMGAPRPGTKSYRFWQFAQSFAKGIASATGIPCIATPVRGPMDPLVQACVTFARTDAHALIKGDALLEWIEQTAYEFRRNAGDEFARYRGGWTHKGLANWLTAGRPSIEVAEGSSGIQINRV
jgi:hypothetical protein